MKKGDARGLSTVVTALIIILLILVAIVIVWGVIRNIIKRGSEDITLGKFTVDLKIESAKKTETNVNVKVKRNPGEGDLKGITFLVFDGTDTHIFEKTNISLEPLERKTFVLDYTGEIITISIAPMFQTSAGKWMTGSIVDTYYFGAAGEGNGGIPCTPNCDDKECGDNGCGGSCGPCPTDKPFCVLGQCQSSSEPCEANCSCASETCIGQTCSDGCVGSCPGTLTLEQDCGDLMCGESPHGCGTCADCAEGYHCDGGICVVSCVPDCGERNCGPVPNECGENCGVCDTEAGEWCEDGYCSSEPCEPDCEERNCGPVPNECGESCGTCNETAGEYCGSEGICVLEEYLNTGTVYSVWPIETRVFFDSPDLPKSGVSYTNYYVRFTTGFEDRCLQIREFVTPVIPEIYNMSYIRFVTSSTSIQAGDFYEVWETYESCEMQ